jgi:hypothetical protein
MSTHTFIAIAVEKGAVPQEYRVIYLALNEARKVSAISSISRGELVMDVLETFRLKQPSRWRAMLKDQEELAEIGPFDFIAQNMFENTHFGNLPTREELQSVLEQLNLRLETRSAA